MDWITHAKYTTRIKLIRLHREIGERAGWLALHAEPIDPHERQAYTQRVRSLRGLMLKLLRIRYPQPAE